MLTQLTQTAIAVLNDIADGGRFGHLSDMGIAPETLATLLSKLERGGLIRRKSVTASGSGSTPSINSTPALASILAASYELCRPYLEITLLQILESIGEHLNCNYPTKEEFYNRYGRAAARLGVVNQMTRTYLAEIKLSDL